MTYIDPLANFSLRCPHCKGHNLTSDNARNHKCLDCLTRCTDDTALPSEAREKFTKKMPTAVIIWRSTDHGRDYRMCLRCLAYLNKAYEFDTSLYKPAQLARLRATPPELLCDHMRRDKVCPTCGRKGTCE
jgi:hypothetical protein